MTLLSELYNIQNEIFNFSDEELTNFSNLYDVRYTFKKVEREINLEKLKILFNKYFKKNIKLNRVDSLIINKCLKNGRKQKKQILSIIIDNYDKLKHMIKNISSININIILIKIIYLIENDISTNKIKIDIDQIKNFTILNNKENDIENILKLIYKKKKFLFPGQKRKPKNKIKINIHLKNEIYQKILAKKKTIFVKEIFNDDDEKGVYDKQLIAVLRGLNKNYQHHVYDNISNKKIEQMKEYFDFLFELKKRDKILNEIITNCIFSFFDDYHIHIDYMLDQDELFTIPFKYEKNNVIYVIDNTIISYFLKLKNYIHIHKIASYYIDYLFDRNYVSKFIDINVSFYFANLLGFLNLIKFKFNKNQKNQIKEIQKIFSNSKQIEKNKKRKSKQENYFQEKMYTVNDNPIIHYNKIINLKYILKNNIKIPKNDDGEIFLDLEVYKSKIRLKNYLKNTFPKTYKRKLRKLKRKQIFTLFQYNNSSFKFKTIIKKENIIKKNKINFKRTIIKIEKFDIKISNIKKKNTIEEINNNIDIINFKNLYNLPIENAEKLYSDFDKKVYQLNENNRNIMLAQKLNSKITVLESQFIKSKNKSKLKREIESLRCKMYDYTSKIQDIDSNGYKYGTNFENQIGTSQYITSDIIKQTKKMQETMDMIDKLSKRKNMNNTNIFVINMVNNFDYIQNLLYDKFDLFINHKIEGLFENWCLKTFKHIKQELFNICKNKKLINKTALDFSRLSMIIFFIIQNCDNISKFYDAITIRKSHAYLNKYVKFENKIGKVLDESDNKLYIQLLNLNIEIVDKNLVEILKNFVNSEVIIKNKKYKGMYGEVISQNGEELLVRIMVYNNFKIVKINIDDIILKKYRFMNNIIIAYPKDNENKDLYAISRFLYNQVTTLNKSTNFNKLYKFTISQINEIIFSQENIKLQKKDIKGIDFNISKTIFRTFDKEGIKILKDNSINYLNEEIQNNKFKNIKQSKFEIMQDLKIQKQEEFNKFRKFTNTFSNEIKNFNISYF